MGVAFTAYGLYALIRSGGSEEDGWGFVVGLVLIVIGASLLQSAYERILKAVEKR